MNKTEAEILSEVKALTVPMEGWQLFWKMGGVTHEEWYKFSRTILSMRANGIFTPSRNLEIASQLNSIA